MHATCLAHHILLDFITTNRHTLENINLLQGAACIICKFNKRFCEELITYFLKMKKKKAWGEVVKGITLKGGKKYFFLRF
jgi:hypothetical protein